MQQNEPKSYLKVLDDIRHYRKENEYCITHHTMSLEQFNMISAILTITYQKLVIEINNNKVKITIPQKQNEKNISNSSERSKYNISERNIFGAARVDSL